MFLGTYLVPISPDCRSFQADDWNRMLNLWPNCSFVATRYCRYIRQCGEHDMRVVFDRQNHSGVTLAATQALVQFPAPGRGPGSG